MRVLLLCSLVLTLACSAASAPAPVADPVTAEVVSSDSAPLRFAVRDGNLDNHFYRDDEVATHVLLRSGHAPRLIASFPAGNTGLGVWMRAEGSAALELDGELEPARGTGMLRGVAADITFDQPMVITRAALGSVRHLRDVNGGQRLPREVEATTAADARSFRVARASLSREHYYELTLLAGEGTVFEQVEHGLVRVVPPAGSPGRLRATFLHDHAPLTPIPLDALLTEHAAPLPAERRALAFLAYEEKLLAGSWRFLTYFGRDTLLSTRLLLPVLRPVAVEGALGSVLDRLDDAGEVAHEEDIGDFAAWRRMSEGEEPSEEPVYDYVMVDDDFMIAPLLVTYLTERPVGAVRAQAFLARETPGGQSYVDAVRSNLEFVLAAAAPFAKEPVAKNLVPLRDQVGDWRDSLEGLGGGVYSYSVNAVLVPAALDAAAALYGMEPWRDDAKAMEAARLAAAWKKAPDLFRVEVPVAEARTRTIAYADQYGIPRASRPEITEPFVFWAVSLRADGTPVRVVHSDIGFELLFGKPEPADLDRMARIVEAPLPLGLRTPLGAVVAHSAFVPDAALAQTFSPDNYHGAVIWSWQQALLAAGLQRQLDRTDLPAETRARLTSAQKALWEVIEANAAQRASEYWSWQIRDGRYELFRPGQGQDHESNAAQLWSTVYLAVQPPR